MARTTAPYAHSTSKSSRTPPLTKSPWRSGMQQQRSLSYPSVQGTCRVRRAWDRARGDRGVSGGRSRRGGGRHPLSPRPSAGPPRACASTATCVPLPKLGKSVSPALSRRATWRRRLPLSLGRRARAPRPAANGARDSLLTPQSRRLLSRGTAPRSRTPCPCRASRHSAPRSSSAALPAPRRGCSTLPSPRPPPGPRTSAKRSTTRMGSCGRTRRRSISTKLFSDGAYPPIRTRCAPGATRTAHAAPSGARERGEREAALRSTRRARWAQVDVNGNGEGLGRGITWAVHPDFCKKMKPRFPEENFNVQLYNMWKVESIFLACSVRRDGPEMRPRRGPRTARPPASRTSRRRSAPPRARGRTTIR